MTWINFLVPHIVESTSDIPRPVFPEATIRPCTPILWRFLSSFKSMLIRPYQHGFLAGIGRFPLFLYLSIFPVFVQVPIIRVMNLHKVMALFALLDICAEENGSGQTMALLPLTMYASNFGGYSFLPVTINRTTE